MTPTTLPGIPVQAHEFYEALAENNSRAWWADHRGQHAQDVREPLVAVLDQLAEEFGEAHVFRPHRDVRFSRDKSPLKDHQGAFIEVAESVGYYLQVSAAGLTVAGGWYSPAGEQLARFRGAIRAGQAGVVRGMVTDLVAADWQVDTAPLKTQPRGVAPDDPDVDLLRMRRVTAARHYLPGGTVASSGVVDLIGSDWRELRALVEWLGDHVGPAIDPGRRS